MYCDYNDTFLCDIPTDDTIVPITVKYRERKKSCLPNFVDIQGHQTLMCDVLCTHPPLRLPWWYDDV